MLVQTPPHNRPSPEAPILSVCPEKVLFSVNHAEKENAAWMIGHIESVVRRWPDRAYRFWHESIAPEGMIQDIFQLSTAIQRGSLGPQASKVNWNVELARIPLREEIVQLFRPVYDKALRSQLDPDLLLKLYAKAFTHTAPKQGVHHFADYDQEVRRGLSRLSNSGIKLKLDMEVAPFGSCMDLLHSQVQLTIANALLSAGHPMEALFHTVGGCFLTQQASKDRDAAFCTRLRERTQPGEVQLIERGYTHGPNMRSLQQDLVEFIDPDHTDIAEKFNRRVKEYDLVNILNNRLMEQPHFEHVARLLLHCSISNTVVQLFDWSVTKTFREFPQIAEAMSDQMLDRWCREVILGKTRPGPMEVVKETLEWLTKQTTAAPEAAKRAKYGLELYIAHMRRKGFA